MDISYTRVSGYLGSVTLMLVGCKGGPAGWRRRRPAAREAAAAACCRRRQTENGGATERNRRSIFGCKNRELLEMNFVLLSNTN